MAKYRCTYFHPKISVPYGKSEQENVTLKKKWNWPNCVLGHLEWFKTNMFLGENRGGTLRGGSEAGVKNVILLFLKTSPNDSNEFWEFSFVWKSPAQTPTQMWNCSHLREKNVSFPGGNCPKRGWLGENGQHSIFFERICLNCKDRGRIQWRF